MFVVVNHIILGIFMQIYHIIVGTFCLQVLCSFFATDHPDANNIHRTKNNTAASDHCSYSRSPTDGAVWPTSRASLSRSRLQSRGYYSRRRTTTDFRHEPPALLGPDVLLQLFKRSPPLPVFLIPCAMQGRITASALQVNVLTRKNEVPERIQQPTSMADLLQYTFRWQLPDRGRLSLLSHPSYNADI